MRNQSNFSQRVRLLVGGFIYEENHSGFLIAITPCLGFQDDPLRYPEHVLRVVVLSRYGVLSKSRKKPVTQRWKIWEERRTSEVSWRVDQI